MALLLCLGLALGGCSRDETDAVYVLYYSIHVEPVDDLNALKDSRTSALVTTRNYIEAELLKGQDDGSKLLSMRLPYGHFGLIAPERLQCKLQNYLQKTYQGNWSVVDANGNRRR